MKCFDDIFGFLGHVISFILKHLIIFTALAYLTPNGLFLKTNPKTNDVFDEPSYYSRRIYSMSQFFLQWISKIWLDYSEIEQSFSSVQCKHFNNMNIECFLFFLIKSVGSTPTVTHDWCKEVFSFFYEGREDAYLSRLCPFINGVSQKRYEIFRSLSPSVTIIFLRKYHTAWLSLLKIGYHLWTTF